MEMKQRPEDNPIYKGKKLMNMLRKAAEEAAKPSAPGR